MFFLSMDLYVYLNFEVDTHKELLGIELEDWKRKIETRISEIPERTLIYIWLKILLKIIVLKR